MIYVTGRSYFMHEGLHWIDIDHSKILGVATPHFKHSQVPLL